MTRVTGEYTTTVNSAITPCMDGLMPATKYDNFPGASSCIATHCHSHWGRVCDPVPRLAVYIRSQSFEDGVACVSKGARLLTCHSICHFDRNRGDQVAAPFIKFPSGVKLSQVFERLARLTELGSESQLGCLFVLPFVTKLCPMVGAVQFRGWRMYAHPAIVGCRAGHPACTS